MIGDYLRAAKAEVARELKESFQYRTALAIDLVVLLLVYSGLLFSGRFTWIYRRYGGKLGDSRGMMLLGYLFWSYSMYALSQMGNDIAREASLGTLEQKFMGVVPIQLLLAAKALGGSVVSSFSVIVLVVISTLFFGVHLEITAIAVLALLITLVGMYGLGFAVAGLAILVKRTGQLVFLLQILLLFLTGTFLPLDVMPAPVAFLGKTIPLTWGIDVSRASVAGTGGIATRWMWLLLTSTASLAFGLLVFSWFCRKAREDGALGRY